MDRELQTRLTRLGLQGVSNAHYECDKQGQMLNRGNIREIGLWNHVET